jgi:hypothetical protein
MPPAQLVCKGLGLTCADVADQIPGVLRSPHVLIGDAERCHHVPDLKPEEGEREAAQ